MGPLRLRRQLGRQGDVRESVAAGGAAVRRAVCGRGGAVMCYK